MTNLRWEISQGTQAVAIGSYEGRSSIEPDVWMSCHEATIPEPASTRTCSTHDCNNTSCMHAQMSHGMPKQRHMVISQLTMQSNRWTVCLSQQALIARRAEVAYLASRSVSSTIKAFGCLGIRTQAQKARFRSISRLPCPCRDLHHCLSESTSESCAMGMLKMLHSSLVMSSYFGSGSVSRMSNDCSVLIRSSSSCGL